VKFLDFFIEIFFSEKLLELCNVCQCQSTLILVIFDQFPGALVLFNCLFEIEVEIFEILRNNLIIQMIALSEDEILNFVLTLSTADQIETFLMENDFLFVFVANDFEILIFLFLRAEFI
jgi:hypothetical protein